MLTLRTYPSRLYDIVYAYHKGEWKHAVDLGCGPGASTV